MSLLQLSKFSDIVLTESDRYFEVNKDETGRLHRRVEGEKHIFDNVNGKFRYVRNTMESVESSYQLISYMPAELLDSWLCGRRFISGDKTYKDSQDNISANEKKGQFVYTAHQALKNIGLSSTRPLRQLRTNVPRHLFTIHFTFQETDIEVVKSTEYLGEVDNSPDLFWEFRRSQFCGVGCNIFIKTEGKAILFNFLIDDTKSVFTGITLGLARLHVRLRRHIQPTSMQNYLITTGEYKPNLILRFEQEFSANIDDCVRYSDTIKVAEPDLSPYQKDKLQQLCNRSKELCREHNIGLSIISNTNVGVLLHGQDIESFKKVLDGAPIISHNASTIDGLTLIRGRDWYAYRGWKYEDANHN